jgi:hypothetical protein
MEMKPINNPNVPGISPEVPANQNPLKADAEKQRPKQGGDRIEFSSQGRALTPETGTADYSREARIESARRKLESGRLVTPESIENAAANLLRSGDLKKADEA